MGREVRVLRGADWYDHPKWYDTLHWPGTTGEVRGLERVARRFCSGAAAWDGERGLRVFEPGCGTARHLRAAARRGHGGVGLDVSEAMVGYGRDRVAAMGAEDRVELVVGDMASFDAGEVDRSGAGFDLAFCLANSVRHLGVSGNGGGCGSDDEMVSHLRRVAGVLRPGGVYAVGIGLTVYGVEEVSEDVWEGSRGRLRVTQVVQYLPARAGEREEGVVSQLAVVTPGVETHVEHGYALRSWDGREWGVAVEEAGLEVAGVVDEDGVDLFAAGDGGWREGWLGYGVFLLRSRGEKAGGTVGG